jgi:hypothetical protein
MQLRILALTLASAAVVVAPLVTTAATAPAEARDTATTSDQTLVIGDCHHLTFEPRKIIPACADLNDFAIVKQYDSWTLHQARGSGTFVLNDCKPDCASGHFHRYAATFSLHKVVKKEDGSRVFSRLGVTYVRHGHQVDLILGLPTTPVIIS